MKKLYRSKTDKIIAGILGGLGDRYEVDPTVLRLAFLALTLITGIFPGVVFYLGALLIVPQVPESQA